MAKPRKLHNGPDKPEGPGDGEAETGGEGEETVTGGEGVEGKERASDDTPPPLLHRREASHQRDVHLARERKEVTAEEETAEE